MVDFQMPNTQDQLDVQVPHKQSLVGNAAKEGLVIGGISAGLGAIWNVNYQTSLALKEFSKAQKAGNASLKNKEIRELFRQEVNDLIKFSKKCMASGLVQV